MVLGNGSTGSPSPMINKIEKNYVFSQSTENVNVWRIYTVNFYIFVTKAFAIHAPLLVWGTLIIIPTPVSYTHLRAHET